MHYRAPNGSTWQDHPLAFMGHYGNYDVFGGDGSTPGAEEFSIRYTVPGQEFWDNNITANYHIATFEGAVGGNVMLNEARAVVYVESGGGFAIPVSRFQGQICMQKLSFHKIVGVRWSRDGGATWQNTVATHWDNNFTQDYVLAKINGTMIR